MCLAFANLLDNLFPVMLNNDQILCWESEQYRFTNSEISFVDAEYVFVKHEDHRIAFLPKTACIKGFPVLLHVVDDIADQSLFGTESLTGLYIRRYFQLNPKFGKISLGFAVKVITVPRLLDDAAYRTFAATESTVLVNLA